MTLAHIFNAKIPELSNPSVCMRDPQRVQEILQSMVKAGSNTVQVISDFDMTLTRFAYNGKRCPTCHNILDNSKLLSNDCKTELKKLLNTYYPIEIDSSRSIEEKLPLMVEWWTKAHELLVQQNIRKDLLAMVVQESDAMLSIPLLIFSAGIGDILEEVIRQAGVFHPNVKVFSNYMDFDESGVLRAFKGELIHIYNKREGALLNTGHFQELRTRPNVLLLGDSLGDLTMADGVEERKQSYLDSYDIVLLKDETLDVPNAIMLYLTGNN
ncbi:hypothetical protein FQN60_004056 [Etheostoma spectabile]|uniref:5'-nucleotidase n=1 Tax=Etheostoma spectabile TaxID=54343 RepID=A0A5J5CSP0_9PERO|nr:hypothetical protein FQN60_004056 [Etheostoma spectabile]